MASEIPSLRPAPTQLTASGFKVIEGDPSVFPQEFLPDGTLIFIQPGVGYELYWSASGKHRYISGFSLVEPLGSLEGNGVTITCDEFDPIPANITLVSRGLGSKHTYDGKIVVNGLKKIGTPTTGTFVAQASTDGDGHPYRQ